MFLFLFNQCTWPAQEGVEVGEGGNAATVSAQSSYTCKRNRARLARCVFCSAVMGRHSTSTKLLFIYLKTCIPWKKMPQDSTVFLKLNPAGWSRRASTPVLHQQQEPGSPRPGLPSLTELDKISPCPQPTARQLLGFQAWIEHLT